MDQDNTSQNGSSSATGVVEQVQQVASQAVGQVQGKAGEVVEQGKAKAGQVVGQVQSEAVSRLSKQKDQAAQGLGSVAEVMRHTSEQLRSEDNGAVAQFAAQGSEAAVAGLEKAANFLRDRDINDIVHEVEGFARREPAIFIGTAFVLGMLAARFLKSSAPASSTAGAGNSAPSYSGSSYAGANTPDFGGTRAITPYEPQATAITGTSPVGSGSFDADTFDADTLPDATSAGNLGSTPEDDSALT